MESCGVKIYREVLPLYVLDNSAEHSKTNYKPSVLFPLKAKAGECPLLDRIPIKKSELLEVTKHQLNKTRFLFTKELVKFDKPVPFRIFKTS